MSSGESEAPTHNTSWIVWEGNIYQGAPKLKVMNSKFTLFKDAKEALISIKKKKKNLKESNQAGVAETWKANTKAVTHPTFWDRPF